MIVIDDFLDYVILKVSHFQHFVPTWPISASTSSDSYGSGVLETMKTLTENVRRRKMEEIV